MPAALVPAALVPVPAAPVPAAPVPVLLGLEAHVQPDVACMSGSAQAWADTQSVPAVALRKRLNAMRQDDRYWWQAS